MAAKVITFPELAQLNAIRLDRDWTFMQLSHAMAGRGVQVSYRTLHYLLKGPSTARPLDRTLHKIRVYLQHVQEHDRRTRERLRTIAANASASKKESTIAAVTNGGA